MYESTKEWVNIPAQLKVFKGRTGSGSKSYDNLVDILVYPVGEVKVVTDDKGAEFVSSTQFYVDGSISLRANDIIIFEEKEHIIGRVSSFYREGRCDIRVGYSR